MAFDAVRFLDRFLRQWNCSDLLLEQRKTLRGKLESKDRELANYNALGYACASRGRYAEAAEAFEDALMLLGHSNDPTAGHKVLINLANLWLEQNDTWKAADLYRRALSEELLDIEDRAVASNGLADCHRRWGDYDAAIALSTEALEYARGVDSPLAVRIALKLARWCCELMRLDDANELLQLAEATATQRAD
jgi:tetratricopeptide (TPR) repeat protein